MTALGKGPVWPPFVFAGSPPCLLAALGFAGSPCVCGLTDGPLLSHGRLLYVCLHTMHVCLCVWIFPFYQDTSHIGLDLIRMTSFELDNLGKDPSSK